MPASFVQNIGTNTQTVAATTLAITVPAAGVQKGNLVLVQIGFNLNAGAAPSVSVADSKGNGWNFAQQNSSGEATPTIQLLQFWSRMAVGSLVAGDTITVTFGVNVTGIVMSADEFGGMRTATASSDNGSANTVAVASTSPTATVTNTSGLFNDMWTGHVLTNGPSSDTFTEAALYTTGARPSIAGLTLNTAYALAPFASTTQTYAPTLGTARIWVVQDAAWLTLPFDPARFNPIPFVSH